MTDTTIDAGAAEILAEIRAMAQTARRSLGQRFRKISGDSQARFYELRERYVWRTRDA